MTDIEFTIIPNDGSIQKLWGHVRPLLKTATDKSSGRYEVDDILDELLSGESQLWVAFTMEREPKIIHALNTRIIQYPRKRGLLVMFSGGVDNRLDDWLEMTNSKLLDFASQNGCELLELTGRRGWARKLPEVGWEEKYCFVEREVSLEVEDVRKSA
jgi:hypothetical protein